MIKVFFMKINGILFMILIWIIIEKKCKKTINIEKEELFMINILCYINMN